MADSSFEETSSSSVIINLDEESSRVRNQLRSHFRDQEWFTFEGIIGQGAAGVSCKILEALPDGRRRRLALKLATNDRTKTDLRNEIQFLKVRA